MFGIDSVGHVPSMRIIKTGRKVTMVVRAM
jgi:hypothetical protein